jgi:TBC1 domain family member 5
LSSFYILDRKDDYELKHLIRKDVDRTMQEYDFFQNEELVKAPMCDLLYIWARENPDYLYQQGMNDVLAVFMICLAIDFKETDI